MKYLASLVLSLGMLTALPAVAQPSVADGNNGSDSGGSHISRPASVKVVTVYLRPSDDSHWSASLSGDLKDPATEKIEVVLADGSVRVMTQAQPGKSRLCLTKMKDRTEYGYLECNSAFFSANVGSSAATTLLRGVLSLGILTAADAASGNTGFTVSLNREALDAAVAESKAVDFARKSAPLVGYRQEFAQALSSQQLRTFIAAYDGVFDPESLALKAKEKLPAVIESEEVRARQYAAEAAQRAEAQRQQEMQRLVDQEALRQFQAGLKPGDRVMMKLRFGPIAHYGMIVEMKPPLAYLQ